MKGDVSWPIAKNSPLGDQVIPRPLPAGRAAGSASLTGEDQGDNTVTLGANHSAGSPTQVTAISIWPSSVGSAPAPAPLRILSSPQRCAVPLV